MTERRPSGATHSFRLQPRAATIMDTHSAIRPNSKMHNKSRWASEAIVWFFDSPLLQKERNPETGDFTGKYVIALQGQPTPVELVKRIEELEKELQDIKDSSQVAESEAKRTPPGGVWSIIRAIIGR